MKFWSIEGNTQKLDGGAMYGNAPRAMWEKWSPPDEKNRIHLACRSLLMQTDKGENILFEAGIGAFFDPALRDRYGVQESDHVLLKSLEKVGVPHDKINKVVLSHLHFDHAGGILTAFEEGQPKLLFPNAKFYVGEEHWNRARNPHPRDKASFITVMNELLESSGRLVLVPRNGASDLAPLITFHFSDGHTPGLMLAQINLKNGPIVFTSDLIPGAPWVHVPLSMGYDRFGEMVIDEKRQLLEELITKNSKLFFTHDPKVPCGLLKRDEKGKFFTEPFKLEELA